jgi:4-amino-4-deoxy-L-arabinose transferase-like glycosyltransferase
MRNNLLLVVLIVSMGLGASILTRGHEWGDDFASYIMQAQSIWTGTTQEFAEHNAFTVFESSNQIGPVAYPWGYPIILTPVYALKGIHPLALKLPGLFFYVGFLICLYLWMKSQLTGTESLLAVTLFAFNPLLLKFLDQVLSDIPFLFFSTLGLLVIENTQRYSNARLLLIGITIFIAYFIRTTGVILLASFIAMELLTVIRSREDRENWHNHLRNIAIVCITFGVLFLANILLFPEGETSHLVRYQEFNIGTAIQFTGAYVSVFRLFFGESAIWQVVYYVLFVFFLIGAWIRRNQDLFLITFFAVWMVVIITWPSWQGVRFIFPLLPIFIYFTFQGMKFLLAKIPTQYTQSRQWSFYGFWSCIALVFLVTSSRNAYINLKNNRAINGPFDPNSREVYQYIQENTPNDSVIVFFKPRVMRLMTNRDSIMSTDCDHILKGNYLVLSKKVGANQQIPPEQIYSCDLFLDTVFENTRFIVYEIQK